MSCLEIDLSLKLKLKAEIRKPKEQILKLTFQYLFYLAIRLFNANEINFKLWALSFRHKKYIRNKNRCNNC
jgi:hypothetical protein